MPMLSDLRYAFRSLVKSPGFTATALTILALCLGANLTIFAVVDAVLLRSLPYPESDRLVALYYTYPKRPNGYRSASLTSYYERRGNIPAFSSIATGFLGTSVIGDTGSTTIQNLARVSPEFFATLGVKPLMGRGFTEAETTYQTDQVAVISYEFWQMNFNGAHDILGKSISVDAIPRVIVGVLPPEFRFLSFAAPVYLPQASALEERSVVARHYCGKFQIARLAPGSTLAEAQVQIDANDAAHAAEYPQAKMIAETGWHTEVVPLQADHVASAKPVLLLLQSGALLLLAIGAVNLTNLLLIRASGRTRELAIRQALGASRQHVVTNVMTEMLVLMLFGALLGIGVGAFGIRLLGALGIDKLPLGARIALDVRVLVAAVLGAVLLGVSIGLPIVWFNLRARAIVALQNTTRGNTVSRPMQRLRYGFIVTQIALAFVLLGCASLLGLSLKRAMSVSPGFRSDHIITGKFNLTWRGYHDLNSILGFFDRLDDKTRSLPGVTAVGAISNVPTTGYVASLTPYVIGYTPQADEALQLQYSFSVAGDYFAAMGIPLRAGRYINQSDVRNEQLPCVVDEIFANRFWPGESAVGKQFYPAANPPAGAKPYTIVGVVGAVKHVSLTEQHPGGAIYFPYIQDFKTSYFLVARATLDPESVGPTLERIIREIDPDMPLTDLRTMEVRIADSLSARRSPALLAGVFGTTALLLASIGLYGVMSYTVALRTNEFGIRMALGARQGDVLRLVFGQGILLASAGVVAGLAAALLLTQYLSSLLFEVKANDPLALIAIGTLLMLVTGLACWFPAKRATKVDPMVALRAE